MSVTVRTRHVISSNHDKSQQEMSFTPPGVVAVEEIHTDEYQSAVNFAMDPMGSLLILANKPGLITAQNPDGIEQEVAIASYGPGQWFSVRIED